MDSINDMVSEQAGKLLAEVSHLLLVEEDPIEALAACVVALQAERDDMLELAAKRIEELTLGEYSDAADGVTVGEMFAKELRRLK